MNAPKSSALQPLWFKAAGLWLVLDLAAAKPRTLLEATSQAIKGGVDAIVFRHKSSSFSDVLDQALAIRSLCREAKVPFVLSHELSYIQSLQPDAVHLAQTHRELRILKTAYPEVLVWGSSTHSLPELQQRKQDGYDYCFLGPIYRTPSKIDLGMPLGVETVQRAHQEAQTFPVVYIGGIDAASAPNVVLNGGQQLAVIRGLLSADEIQTAVQHLKHIVTSSLRQNDSP